MVRHEEHLRARQAADRKRSPNGRRALRLSGYRTKKKHFFLLKRNQKQSSQTKSIAVTSRNSLVWTVLHIKYNMGSKREDPKCCKPRIKDTIWINAFQNFLGIRRLATKKTWFACAPPFFSKQSNPLLAVTGIGWHSRYNISDHLTKKMGLTWIRIEFKERVAQTLGFYQ